jgi:hypothetical protein
MVRLQRFYKLIAESSDVFESASILYDNGSIVARVANQSQSIWVGPA